MPSSGMLIKKGGYQRFERRADGTISASPTACPLRGYGRAGTQNDRLGEAVVLSTGTPLPAQCTCRRRCRYVVMLHVVREHVLQSAPNRLILRRKWRPENDVRRQFRRCPHRRLHRRPRRSAPSRRGCAARVLRSERQFFLHKTGVRRALCASGAWVLKRDKKRSGGVT